MQDFSPRDKQRFRDVIDTATPREHSGDLDQYALASFYNHDAMRDSDDLLVGKLITLGRIWAMATDSAWELRRLDKRRIVSTYHYLSIDNQDILTSIEWSILWSAAIELLEHDCQAELAMYDEFCELRRGETNLSFTVEHRADWLRYKREELQRTGRRLFLGMRRSKTKR